MTAISTASPRKAHPIAIKSILPLLPLIPPLLSSHLLLLLSLLVLTLLHLLLNYIHEEGLNTC